jgi:pimeloyl-ACP methyl ester carboxylesterase
MKQIDFEIDGHHLFCLAYNTDAKGTPVILLHGLLSSPYFWWKEHVKWFEKYGPIYAISLPGHFPSVFPNNDVKIDEDFLAKMVSGQIKYLVGDQPVILVGHSTGGEAALISAIYHPEILENLIIMSAKSHGRVTGGIFGFFQFIHCHLGFLGRWVFSAIVKANSFSRSVHKYLLSDVAYDKAIMFSYPGFDDYIDFYLPAQKRLDNKSMGAYFKGLYEIDFTDKLSEIKCPVLLLYSENDPYISVDDGKSIHKHIAQSELKIIPNSGHLFMFETPETSYNILTAWLDKTI